MWSHPHGCVSWNVNLLSIFHAPSSSHPHGCVSWNQFQSRWTFCWVRHTLTGVWVEIYFWPHKISYSVGSHPHGCVSWNIKYIVLHIIMIVTPSRVCELKCKKYPIWTDVCSHTLTGVWVEIQFRQLKQQPNWVTPSRVCELKYPYFFIILISTTGHTLTGVWVEILFALTHRICHKSHPHGCVSWNLHDLTALSMWQVTPSRVCELKCQDFD